MLHTCSAPCAQVLGMTGSPTGAAELQAQMHASLVTAADRWARLWMYRVVGCVGAACSSCGVWHLTPASPDWLVLTPAAALAARNVRPLQHAATAR